MERRKFLTFFGLFPTAGALGLGSIPMFSSFLNKPEIDACDANPRNLLSSLGYDSTIRLSCERAINRQIDVLKVYDSKKLSSLNLTDSEVTQYARNMEDKLFHEFAEHLGSSLTEEDIKKGIAFFNSETGKKITGLFNKLQAVGTPIIDQGSPEIREKFLKKA